MHNNNYVRDVDVKLNCTYLQSRACLIRIIKTLTERGKPGKANMHNNYYGQDVDVKLTYLQSCAAHAKFKMDFLEILSY